MKKYGWIVYGTIAILELGSEFWEMARLHHLTKPLLMPTLIGTVWVSLGRQHPFKWLLLGALLFSWLGDVTLMFQQQMDMAFLIGLGSFLIAHLLYVWTYQQARWSVNLKNNWWRWIIMILVMVYYFSFVFARILSNLADLKIPVIIYALVITAMVFSAFGRRGYTSSESYYLVIFGALLFMMSDSLISLNKFYHPISYSGFWIMSTYILGQGLIVRGLIRHPSSS